MNKPATTGASTAGQSPAGDVARTDHRAEQKVEDLMGSIADSAARYRREEADRRKRLREMEEAEADILVGRSGEQVPVTTYVDSHYWTCQVCGWLGKGHHSTLEAMASARLHFQAEHPERDQAKVVAKDIWPANVREADNEVNRT